MATENPYGRILIIGICAVVFFIVVAYSFQGMLGGLAQPVPHTDLVVQGSVQLQGAGEYWPPGNYQSCYTLTTYDTCLQGHITSQPVISPLFVVLSLMAVFFAIALLLVFAKRAQE